MSDDITARARAALEGVTEGPWETIYHQHDTSYPSDTYHVITERTGDLIAEADDESRSYDEPHAEFGRDAQFIAAARTLVPELLAEVERQRGGREVERGMLHSAAAEINRLASEVERLRGALDGLADELQAHVHTTPSDDDHEIICDVESTIACRIRDVLRGDQ